MLINKIPRILYQGFLAKMGLGFITLSVFTLVPSSASKLNKLNYFSVCSFAPFSTTLLLVFATVCVFLVYRSRIKQ